MKNTLNFLKRTARLMAIAFCAVPVLYSCGNDPVPDPANIIMVTDTAIVRFNLAGSGKASIDWGDGSELETFSATLYYQRSCEHVYSGTYAHTVRIYGENITKLNCIGNHLTSLDISKNTALIVLSCESNQLASLNVNSNTVLAKLSCGHNQLTSLDVSNCTALLFLHCYNNQFSVDGLNKLFGTLHGSTLEVGKSLYIGNNPGTAGCDRSIAEEKGWIVN